MGGFQGLGPSVSGEVPAEVLEEKTNADGSSTTIEEKPKATTQDAGDTQ
jgi:hypothetical protein